MYAPELTYEKAAWSMAPGANKRQEQIATQEK